MRATPWAIHLAAAANLEGVPARTFDFGGAGVFNTAVSFVSFHLLDTPDLVVSRSSIVMMMFQTIAV